ncbi:MAG TPA: VOC family protein [Bacteroidetes bacterium]|nr:VOC family protein [Bacteroidota bacterium]
MNLNQVTVPTLNVDRSILFYKKLGLKLIVHTGPHYARFECPEGSATFSLHLVEALPKGHGVTVYFEQKNMDAYVQELIGKGIEFEEMPDDKRWLWREAKLRDPDGNQLIIYYAGKNRKNPPWRKKE